MVVICGWCKRYLGTKEPADRALVSHEICPVCAARLGWKESPILVVSPKRRDLVPVLEELLRGSPRIQITLDRRRGSRRERPERDQPAPERRRSDRRRGAVLLLA
jgi:hypothetical protein